MNFPREKNLQLNLETNLTVNLYYLCYVFGTCPYRLSLEQPPLTNHTGIISHPWQRDTGEYDAQGPNIMLPEAPRMLPEARRAELEARRAEFEGRGRTLTVLKSNVPPLVLFYPGKYANPSLLSNIRPPTVYDND